MFKPSLEKIKQAQSLVDQAISERGAYTLHSLGVAGSFSYGLAHADSDLDIRGVYSMSTSDLVLGNNPDKVINIQFDSLDITLWELSHFCRLALKCNPNLLEFVFLPEYIVSDHVGLALVALQSSFLSAPCIRSSFGGFATGQIRRAQSQQGANDVKLFKHAVRTLLGGICLLEEGVYPVQVRPEHKELIQGIMDKPLEVRVRYIETLLEKLDTMETDLPDEPSVSCVVNMLTHQRLEQLQSSI